MTILATAAVVAFAAFVRGHYARSARRLTRLDTELAALDADPHPAVLSRPEPGRGRTAIVLCNGYNGLGVQTVLGLFRMFPNTFDRCVFVHVGAVDAGSFKGVDELERLRQATEEHARRYVQFCQRRGVSGESLTAIGYDVLTTIRDQVDEALRRHPGGVVFAGQLSFQYDTRWTRWLHNHVAFELQRVYGQLGIPFVIVPIRVGHAEPTGTVT